MKIVLNEIELERLATHYVGNSSREEGTRFSDEETFVAEDSKEFLIKYFMTSFKTEEYYHFIHAVDLQMNEVFTIVRNMFADSKNFLEQSKNITKMLYEYSNHPKIKSGELNIAYFTNVSYENEIVDVIGIFKSDERETFLKINDDDRGYRVGHEMGININKLEKGCLIINTEEDSGYRILLADSINRTVDAQYWKDDFLKIDTISDEFHNTKNFMTITKEFVTNNLDENFKVSKADKIDLLNRSVDYFKKNDNFDKKSFEKEVFCDDDVIKSFQKFDESFRDEFDICLDDNFEISKQAVKKQAKILKSVLKLDKNFHIYIHGDREMIEQGEDNGKKFYKFYYSNEE